MFDLNGAGYGARAARLAYVAILLLATLVPFAFDPTVGAVLDRLARALNPTLTPRDAVDAARNLTLFAGWGALWYVTSARATRQPLAIVVAATLTGAAISLSVETLQLFSARRHASVVDLFTNSGGAFAGASALALLAQAARAAHGRRSFFGIPAFSIAGAYLGAAFLEALMPLLRQSTLPGATGGPLARFNLALELFRLDSIFELPLTGIVLFVPLGALGVMALVELGNSYFDAAVVSGVASLAVAGFAEVAHGMLGQPIVLGAILGHGIGAAIGAAAAARWLPPLSRRLRGRPRIIAFAFAYTALLAFWAWRPFAIETDPAAFADLFALRRWVPLQAHAPQVNLFSVVDVAKSFFLFLPLGALLRVWPLRLRGRLSVFLPACYLACATEIGQILVADRFFDVTDILVASAAGMIGWAVTKRAGFKPYGELLPRQTGAAA